MKYQEIYIETTNYHYYYYYCAESMLEQLITKNLQIEIKETKEKSVPR